MASASRLVAFVASDERGGGCSIPSERVKGRLEHLLVDAREEVGQRSVRERRDAEPNLGERRSESSRGRFRALYPLGRPGVPPGEHGPRDVQHDEGLGIGARLERRRPLDHGLCRGKGEKRSRGDNRQDRDNEHARARIGQAQHVPEPAGTPPHEEERQERNQDAEGEEDTTRSEKDEVHGPDP